MFFSLGGILHKVQNAPFFNFGVPLCWVFTDQLNSLWDNASWCNNFTRVVVIILIWRGQASKIILGPFCLRYWGDPNPTFTIVLTKLWGAQAPPAHSKTTPLFTYIIVIHSFIHKGMQTSGLGLVNFSVFVYTNSLAKTRKSQILGLVNFSFFKGYVYTNSLTVRDTSILKPDLESRQKALPKSEKSS